MIHASKLDEHFTEKEILNKEIELRHLAKLTNEDLLIKQFLGVGFSIKKSNNFSCKNCLIKEYVTKENVTIVEVFSLD